VLSIRRILLSIALVLSTVAVAVIGHQVSPTAAVAGFVDCPNYPGQDAEIDYFFGPTTPELHPGVQAPYDIHWHSNCQSTDGYVVHAVGLTVTAGQYLTYIGTDPVVGYNLNAGFSSDHRSAVVWVRQYTGVVPPVVIAHANVSYSTPCPQQRTQTAWVLKYASSSVWADSATDVLTQYCT
jgi:hypothetical protein